MLAKQSVFLLAFLLLITAACTRPPADPGDTSNVTVAPPGLARKAAQPTPRPAPVPAGQTKLLMHNVILNKAPGFRLRVRWLRGEMRPTRAGVPPSFDDPNSFTVEVQDGVVATNLPEIASLLNSGLLKGTPLENVSLSSEGKQLKLNGTLHKGLPLPVEMISDLGASPDGRIQLHVVKMHVLKMPVKGLLHTFKVGLSDLINPKGAPSVEISGDYIYLRPELILPAPTIHGKLTDVHIGDKSGDLVSVYGAARPEVQRVKQWRNFIRLSGGTIVFGKLTMAHADLFLIDASNDEWFNFDLSHYQEQLVNGHIEMTPEAGLRVFMPGIDKIPATDANRSISLEWMKHRNQPPPPDVTQ